MLTTIWTEDSHKIRSKIKRDRGIKTNTIVHADKKSELNKD
jgi:hypothetical protein